ncbi:MAG: CbiX/SirB N-terminal domain-containing protein [Betaproteobacteria bacterium]
MTFATILFAHGARDPQWAEPFERIRARMLAVRPDLDVRLAYLELMTPSLEDAVAACADKGVVSIRLIPLFMAQGGHLKQDLPKKIAALRERHPAVAITVSPPIGEVEAVLDLIATWALAQS